LLVFDKSLKAHDTLCSANKSTFVIDSMVIKEWGGKPRTHWYMTSNAGKRSVWIENIGNAESFSFENIGTTDSTAEITCFQEDNELVYQNPKFNSCLICVSSQELSIKKQLISLFGIGEGQLNIQLTYSSSGDLYLYSFNGRLLMKEKINKSEMLICPPESGVLLYRFITSKGDIETGKVIVR